MTENRSRGVARIWRGRTRPERADEYTQYLYEHGVKKLQSLGARGVQMFREDRDSESEFMVISYWETAEAMTRWAGEDPRRIRHLERDPEFLIEVPTGVQVLDVYSNTWFLAEGMR